MTGAPNRPQWAYSAVNVVECKEHPRDWRVEAFDEDGGCDVTEFIGRNAYQRAADYAASLSRAEKLEETTFGERGYGTPRKRSTIMSEARFGIAPHNLLLEPIKGHVTGRWLFVVRCTCGWCSAVRFSDEAVARRRFADHAEGRG